MTAIAVSNSVIDGAVVSALGMFDQGYYDRLGFGTLPYHRVSTFDPAILNVPKLTRAPFRLSKEDAEQMHACRLRRKRGHGACNFEGVGATASELNLGKKYIWTWIS